MSFILNAIAAHDPYHVALRDETQTITYGGLQKMIRLYARKLENISCAALTMDNSVEWVIWDLAALESGTVLVPIPPFFTTEQTDHALHSAGCDAIIMPHGMQSAHNAPVSLPKGTAKITYTSGTTGTPKGVCLPASAMENVARGVVDVLGPDLAGQHLSILPLAVLLENVAGVYAALIAGCTITLPALGSFRKNYADLHTLLKDAKASSAILVPEILRLLMTQIITQGPLPDLKFLAVGGSKMDPALIAQARMLGLPVYEGYGLSECASVVALNTPAADKPGSVGKFLPHVKARIEHDEIIIDDPGFLGYVGQPFSGGFDTGDIGQLDDDGFLSITGRKKNILITSYGRNVSPEWVEAALLAQPAIAQAVVFGDAQPHLSAFIVPSLPAANIQKAVDAANAMLPDYAQIHSFYPVPPLSPADETLTGTGRPRRSRIFQLYAKEIAMNFYERLKKETETERAELYTVPQLVDGLHGDINRDTYIAYLTQAYHHVKHTVRFMMAMGARLPDNKKWLHDAISEYIEEEKGHEEWILNDIAAAGGNKEAARNVTPNLETQILVAYNYDYIARKNPVGFLGMVFMLESTSTQIANTGADAVKDKLGLPKSAFSYLYSHGALDIEHLKFFETLVNRIDDPEDQAAIIEVAQNTFRLFAGVMRSIPHQQGMKHAA
jgi:acyl-CoA synthetase (AMP-forming)/AMP-acid ligase II/thiaminase